MACFGCFWSSRNVEEVGYGERMIQTRIHVEIHSKTDFVVENWWTQHVLTDRLLNIHIANGKVIVLNWRYEYPKCIAKNHEDVTLNNNTLSVISNFDTLVGKERVSVVTVSDNQTILCELTNLKKENYQDDNYPYPWFCVLASLFFVLLFQTWMTCIL